MFFVDNKNSTDWGLGIGDWGLGIGYADASFDCDSNNVEESCFNFLTQAMAYTSAVACGALANIKVESDGFQVDINEYGGGGGYGLIQWTGQRNTDLKRWCPQNGYDYTTLEGQLSFMQHELVTDWGAMNNKLAALGDDASSCQEAAEIWCLEYEIPADKYAKAAERAQLAMNEFYPKYCGGW